MTNEKILEILMEIKSACYDYDSAEDFAENTREASQMSNAELAYMIKRIGGQTALPFIIENSIRLVKEDMTKKSLPADEKSRLKACKNILKNAKKTNPLAESLRYANTIDRVQYICDGYRLVGFTTPLPLEEKPKNMEDTVNLKRIIEANIIIGNETSLDLPNKKSLEVYIKTKKAEQKVNGTKNPPAIRYNFGKDLPMVNAEYLLDMMNIFPDTVFLARKSHAILIKDNNGNIGVLNGLRKPDTDIEVTKL